MLERYELAWMLMRAKRELEAMRGGRKVEKAGGAFGDATNDTDNRLGGFIGSSLFDRFENIGKVSVEGSGDATREKGDWWATVDPIDGSLNYLHAGSRLGFPYSACVTILRQMENAIFDDVILAGVIDLRPTLVDELWIVEGLKGDYKSFGPLDHMVSGKEILRPMSLLPAKELNLGRMNVIGEFYYPENRDRLVHAFAGEEGWLRNPGSAAYEMASVASGQAVAYICDRQKQHELGAGYALVKGAGGVAVDWDGNDLGSRTYDFKTQTPVILAANQGIADQILERLHRP